MSGGFDWDKDSMPAPDDSEESFWKELEEQEQMSIARPKKPAKFESRLNPHAEAAVHGYFDMVPFGQDIAAGTSNASIKTLKALEAMGLAPSYYQNLPDTTYQGELEKLRSKLAYSDKNYPKSTTGGRFIGGTAATLANPFQPAANMSRLMNTGTIAANGTLYGLLHGLGRGDSMDERLENAAWEAPVSGLSGLAGHAFLGKALPAAMRYGGTKAQDFAGWLKVNSLKPNPTVAEKMAELPGGTSGVGKELLQRGIGKLTKAGTSKQLDAARDVAGAKIGKLAEAYDDAGGQPIDLVDVMDTARERAGQLLDNPPSTAAGQAGQRLLNLIEEYEAKFASGAATGKETLAFKRALGDEAYGLNNHFARSGETVSGHYGKGVGVFERAADDALDKSIGPSFAEANLLFRRLKGAAEAADRTAARAQGNGLMSLKDMLAPAALGATGGVFGDDLGVGRVPLAMIGMGLGTRYGSQLAARTLFNLGGAARATPSLFARAGATTPLAANALGGVSFSAGRIPTLRLAGPTAAERERTLSELYADAGGGR